MYEASQTAKLIAQSELGREKPQREQKPLSHTPSQQGIGYGQQYNRNGYGAYYPPGQGRRDIEQEYERESELLAAEQRIQAQMRDFELEPEEYPQETTEGSGSHEYDQYDTDMQKTALELENYQREMIPRIPYDYPIDGKASLAFSEADFAHYRDTGWPRPYELPLMDSYHRDLAIVKRHNAGCFGATAILRVLNDSPESVTSTWYRAVGAGTKIIAKRITACDRVRARSWQTESEALKHLTYTKPESPNILKLIGRLRPTKEDPYGHIFTEYCSLGDVSEIMNKYMALNKK
ncbi:uncharacterized protein DFL_000140 [Arthrobotrys flagrans]|uniref:Protein kinase domain-containing protein n=1 Tax=Arthrobotrys flagrans TaxID=97331 RepID=A0A437ACW7_ARTFL|nr:hypothetical protein DFL_000140 [Arthrobotrys flagrans]